MPPKKKSKPTTVIVIAVVLVLAIAAAVVFAYVKSRDKGLTPPVTKTTPKVTSSDVTSTSNQLDTDLKKVDDSKDFSEAYLTDQTLGL